MTIAAAACDSYKLEVLQGIHSSSDTYKIALFLSTAALSKATTAYSSTGEASGVGYTAGGAALSGFAVSQDVDTAIVTFSNPSWANSTITARGAMIFNASKANRAVAVLDFGGDVSSTNGTFSITFPSATQSTGLIRIS